MDAQNSQSTNSAKRINGIKIKTQSVRFRVDFDDLPSPQQEGGPNDMIVTINSLMMMMMWTRISVKIATLSRTASALGF